MKTKQTIKKCPGCKTDLKKGGLYWISEGRTAYKMYYKNGGLQHKKIGFEETGDITIRCAKCGRVLEINPYEAENILKKNEKRK